MATTVPRSSPVSWKRILPLQTYFEVSQRPSREYGKQWKFKTMLDERPNEFVCVSYFHFCRCLSIVNSYHFSGAEMAFSSAPVK